ncbi:MAG: hypothetical protein A7315_05310 [Candidatus Altiarchaeales archaeon WOR_SM1_79]|nr:MAG: hypothetical protein A7315_05310 [Candidatus Altiarchaeales archaeon WOR_SM1_79]
MATTRIEGRRMGIHDRIPDILPSLNSQNKQNEKSGLEKTLTLITILILLFSHLTIIFSLTSMTNVAAQSIEQRVEPVIILGSDIPVFIGIPVNDIWVYAYSNDEWEQIPFQIDERNDINGSYFFDAVDGVFDDNDEIVFMPSDAGQFASTTSWVSFTELDRYAVTITDPIDSSSKFVYVYNSSSLTQTFTKDNVDYNHIHHRVIGNDYTIEFDNDKIGIIDKIKIDPLAGGDGEDILDRLKFRIQKTIELSTYQCYEDEFLYDLIGYKDGPVRVIRQTAQRNENDTEYYDFRMITTLFCYKSYLTIDQSINTNTSSDWVRISFDFLSSSSPMTYYDSNNNYLIIDGELDTLGSTAVPTWTEITGTHATIITLGNFSKLGGTQSLYYNDNFNSDDGPESDYGEYGNNGMFATDSPDGISNVYFSIYFLSAYKENIGTIYANYGNNPLETNISAQSADPSPPPQILDLTAIPYPQEAGGYVNISATIEDNLGKLSGSWVDVTDPNGLPVGNFSLSYDSNTNRYYNKQIYSVLGTYNFVIYAADTSGNWNSNSGQFVIQDTTLPIISDVLILPDQQESNDYVNISAIVTDMGLEGVWIEIIDPDEIIVGNFSMSYDAYSNRYFYKQTYEIVGVYKFNIWVFDHSNNWNSSSGQFIIQDTISPVIKDLKTIPDPQEIDGNVNISLIIEDSYLDGIWVDIKDPNGFSVGNYSMLYESTIKRYYWVDEYSVIGTYQFTIWVVDQSGNWNSSSGQFLIQDTKPPIITDVSSNPETQGIGGLVNISALVVDAQLDKVWVHITDPNGKSVGNFSMVLDGIINTYYYTQTYATVGNYIFIIWAYDLNDNWNSSSSIFTISDNIAPNANAGSDKNVIEGSSVTFNGKGSTDNIGIINYTWSFTDVTIKILYGANPTYTFNNPGNFEIVLKVIDEAGNWNTDRIWINVSELIMTGLISGVVRDGNGNPIKGAAVIVVGTPYQATTNETGFYIISNVPAGTYNLTVTGRGYKTDTIFGVEVIEAQYTQDQDFIMKEITEEEGEGFPWIIPIIIAIVFVLLFLFFTVLRKEKREEKIAIDERLFEEPSESMIATKEAQEQHIGESLRRAVEHTTAVQGYDATIELAESMEEIVNKLESPSASMEEAVASSLEMLDIEKELEELLREPLKPEEHKNALEDELEALSQELDKILNESDIEEEFEPEEEPKTENRKKSDTEEYEEE